MEKQKNNGRDFCRPQQKSNNRWQWMAGATAAAGVAASQASATTITLVNNYISSTGGDHLDADLTGDGHSDLTITGASAFHSSWQRSGFPYVSSSNAVAADLNGILAAGHNQNGYYVGVWQGVRLGSQYGPSAASSLTGSIPVFFKDLHINGGAPTTGSLEVTVSFTKVQLDSLTYNGPVQSSRLGVAVPDEGSSLGLLALGAGGVAAFRRRVVQGRC